MKQTTIMAVVGALGGVAPILASEAPPDVVQQLFGSLAPLALSAFGAGIGGSGALALLVVLRAGVKAIVAFGRTKTAKMKKDKDPKNDDVAHAIDAALDEIEKNANKSLRKIEKTYE